MRRCFTLFAVLGALAGGCAPFHTPPGPPIAPPRLADSHLIMADGARLPLRRWGPQSPAAATAGRPRAVVLALHGFNDYSKAFDGPARAFAKTGIATYAYDQRGFGEAPNRGAWPGVAGMTGDLRAAAQLLRAAHPETPFYILGESMGAAVVMAALAERPHSGSDSPAAGPPLAADGYILSAPAIWARRVMPAWQRIGLEVVAHTIPLFHVTGQGFNRTPSDNIDMLRALGRDPLVIKHTRIDTLYGLVDLMDAALDAAPRLAAARHDSAGHNGEGRTLILLGQKEDILPSAAMQALLGALPSGCGVQVARYRAGYHMLLRDLKADVVLADLAAWMARPGRALPSGADREEGSGEDTDRPVAAAAQNRDLAGAEGSGVRTQLALSCAPPIAARP